MRTVKDLLQDADPLRDDSLRIEEERDRLRRTVVSAASHVTTRPPLLGRRALLLATVPVLVAGIVAIGSQLWPPSIATLQAAVRFEVRLAEDHPAPGLREARAAGSDRVVYVHEEIVVTNDDLAKSRVIPGDGPSRFSVLVELNAAGADKMLHATAGHTGRPVAILIDGVVVAAPVVRGSIGSSAVISGDFSKAEAERIVNGIGPR
jgi:hypothetical protein